MSESVVACEEAVATASTGDIWLFRGTAVADWTIRAATNSPVNHVGMVVALDDLPPLLWHAELGRSLPDVWTDSGNAECSSIASLTPSPHGIPATSSAPGCASSSGPIERYHEDRVLEVIERFDGRPFPTTLELLTGWLRSRTRRHVLGRERVLRRTRRHDLPGTWGCFKPRPAELV